MSIISEIFENDLTMTPDAVVIILRSTRGQTLDYTESARIVLTEYHSSPQDIVYNDSMKAGEETEQRGRQTWMLLDSRHF